MNYHKFTYRSFLKFVLTNYEKFLQLGNHLDPHSNHYSARKFHHRNIALYFVLSPKRKISTKLMDNAQSTRHTDKSHFHIHTHMGNLLQDQDSTNWCSISMMSTDNLDWNRDLSSLIRRDVLFLFHRIYGFVVKGSASYLLDQVFLFKGIITSILNNIILLVHKPLHMDIFCLNRLLSMYFQICK